MLMEHEGLQDSVVAKEGPRTYGVEGFYYFESTAHGDEVERTP